MVEPEEAKNEMEEPELEEKNEEDTKVEVAEAAEETDTSKDESDD